MKLRSRVAWPNHESDKGTRRTVLIHAMTVCAKRGHVEAIENLELIQKSGVGAGRLKNRPPTRKCHLKDPHHILRLCLIFHLKYDGQ